MSILDLAKLCGVCNEHEPKYKCSQCYLPYCSVACSKTHKETHPAVEPVSRIEEPASRPPSKRPAPRAGTTAAAGYQGPFVALDDSKELRELFKLYPNLPSQLEAIDAVTLRPDDEQGFDRRISQKGGNTELWSTDRGLRKGVEALSQARNTSGKEGEGVREFSRLIIQILSGENGNEAAEIIQKEIAEENARIIEQLLNNER